MKYAQSLTCLIALVSVGCSSSPNLLEPGNAAGGTGTTTSGGTTTTTGTGGTTSTTGGTTTGSASTTGGGTTGGPVSASEQRKQSAVASLSTYFSTLAHKDPPSDNALVLTYLQSSRDFQNVTQYQGLISTQFFDGETFVYINNQPYPTSGNFTTAPGPSRSFTRQAEYPSGKRYVLVNTLPPGDAFQITLGDMLGKVYTYANNTLGAIQATSPVFFTTVNGEPVGPSYSAFSSSFKNIDVLVWTGHCAGDPDRGQFYLDIPVNNNAGDLSPDPTTLLIDGGAVVRSVTVGISATINGITFSTPTTTQYAITSKFFQKYASFNPGGLAMIDACFSSSIAAADTQNAMKGAGASRFAGWNQEVAFGDMFETTQVFFDEVLGNNDVWANYHTHTEPSRAWPYNATLDDFTHLTRKNPAFPSLLGYTLDHSFAANFGPLALFHPTAFQVLPLDSSASVTDAGLRPSIQNVTIDEQGLKMTLSGSFSSSQGSGDGVQFQGSDLSVSSWNNTQIVCTSVPAVGGGSVMVTANNVMSNIVPITEYSVSKAMINSTDSENQDTSNIANYSYSSVVTDHTRQGTESFKFRVDAHGFRTQPQDAIQGVSQFTSEGNGTLDSAMDSGTTTYNLHGGSSYFVTYSLNPISFPAKIVNASGSVDRSANNATLNFGGSTAKGEHTQYSNVPVAFDLPFGLFGSLKMTLDPTSYLLTVVDGLMYFGAALPEPAGSIPSGGTTSTIGNLTTINPDSNVANSTTGH